MVHLAIYNLDKHVVEHKEKYADDETTDDGYNAADHNQWRLAMECLGRGTIGGEWRVYRGAVAFDWKHVEPKEAALA
jgi:hypothetical protein